MLDVVLYRYFLCFRVYGEVTDEIHRLRHTLGVGGRWVACDRLHLTLQITPEYTGPQPALVEAYKHALDGLHLPRCWVVLDEIVSNGDSVVLRPSECLADLQYLQRFVADHMAVRGIPARPVTRFAPHVTLAYGRLSHVRSAIDPISWQPNEVFLIESRIGKTEHHILGRWPLSGNGQPAPETMQSKQGYLPF